MTSAPRLRRSTPHRPAAGGTIVTSLVFILIIALSVAAMLQYSTSSQRLTARRLERESLFNTAEAGIDQVVHWFNFPGDYTSDTTLFTKDPGTDTYYDSSDVNVFVSRGLPITLIDFDSSDNEDLIRFTNEPINTGERARVTELIMEVPTAADVALEPYAILAVSSTSSLAEDLALAPGQRRTRTIRTVLSALPPFPVILPAAIISPSSLGSNGQFNLHWGEAWTQNDMVISNMNNITSADGDPWAKYRTGGFFMKDTDFAIGADGNPNSGSSWDNTPLDPAASNYYQPWLGFSTTYDVTNIYQHQDFTSIFASEGISDWGDFELDYDFWKTMALTRGFYFSTDASGNVYRGTEESADTLITAAELNDLLDQSPDLTVNTSVEGSQTLPEPLVVFIDTVDGQPPAADGSNLPNIVIDGGGGAFTRGIMYVAGNLEFAGAGDPADIWIQDPEFVDTGGVSGTQRLEPIRWMGVIYTSGIYDQQGNPEVYGSLVAKEGFGTSGTPIVWYDQKLKKGLPFSFNSEVSVAYWTELNPTDVAMAGP